MYIEFYGFAKEPFKTTPDVDFLFLSPSHREALSCIDYGIRQRKGFIAIIGEVGGRENDDPSLLSRQGGSRKTENHLYPESKSQLRQSVEHHSQGIGRESRSRCRASHGQARPTA